MVVYWTVMIGFMCGAFAKFFTPKLKQGDVFITMTIGLVGSVFFGWLGDKTALYDFGSYYSLIASFIGASALLFFYHEYIARYGPSRPSNRPKNGQAQ